MTELEKQEARLEAIKKDFAKRFWGAELRLCIEKDEGQGVRAFVYLSERDRDEKDRVIIQYVCDHENITEAMLELNDKLEEALKGEA